MNKNKKGNDHLTVTWKVNENCFQHVDILEEKKLNAFSVGKRLIIDGEDFEDLDEILARLISPMANYVREIMAHKNYQTFAATQTAAVAASQTQNADETLAATQATQNSHVNQIEHIEQYLTEERTRAPAKIPYVFTCCVAKPGRFMISYMIKLKLRNEYIGVTHEGFKFRQKLFRSFNELVAWFKVHFNDPLPVAAASMLPPPSSAVSVPPPPSPRGPRPPTSSARAHTDLALSSQMSSMSVEAASSYSNSHSEMPAEQTHSYSTSRATNPNEDDWDSVAYGGTTTTDNRPKAVDTSRPPPPPPLPPPPRRDYNSDRDRDSNNTSRDYRGGSGSTGGRTTDYRSGRSGDFNADRSGGGNNANSNSNYRDNNYNNRSQGSSYRDRRGDADNNQTSWVNTPNRNSFECLMLLHYNQLTFFKSII